MSKKRLFCLLWALILALPQTMPAAPVKADEPEIVEEELELPDVRTSEGASLKEDKDNKQIILSKVTARTEDGKESETGNISTMTHEEMVKQAKGGKAYDAKSQGYATEADKAAGIMQISHDILGTDLSFNEKSNFIFMLDISGSMGDGSGTSGAIMKESVAKYIEDHIGEMNNVMAIAYVDVLLEPACICRDKSNIANWVRRLTIDGNESYGDSFRLGVAEIESYKSVYQDRRLNTVFIGDGGHTGMRYTEYLPKYQAKVAEVTDRSKIYAIGFPGAIESELTAIATDPTTTKICQDQQEFNDYLKYMQDDITRYPKDVSLQEKFNTMFDIIVDESHPITINGKDYSSLEEATAPGTGFTYNAATREVVFTLKEMSKTHTSETLTYYAKPTETINGADIKVHEETNMTYIEPTNTGYAAKEKIQMLDTMLLTRQQSIVEGVLEIAEENTEASLKINEEVGYRVTFTNTGTLTAEMFSAEVKLPEGMTFKEVSPEFKEIAYYDEENHKLVLHDITIEADNEITIPFTMTVNGEAEGEMPATLSMGVLSSDSIECNTVTVFYKPELKQTTTPPADEPEPEPVLEKAEVKGTAAEGNLVSFVYMEIALVAVGAIIALRKKVFNK